MKSVQYSAITLVMLAGCGSADTGSQSNSQFDPSAQSVRDIENMEGSRADKEAAKDAVRRFNEAAAARGEGPTGL